MTSHRKLGDLSWLHRLSTGEENLWHAQKYCSPQERKPIVGLCMHSSHTLPGNCSMWEILKSVHRTVQRYWKKQGTTLLFQLWESLKEQCCLSRRKRYLWVLLQMSDLGKADCTAVLFPVYALVGLKLKELRPLQETSKGFFCGFPFVMINRHHDWTMYSTWLCLTPLFEVIYASDNQLKRDTEQ